MCGYNAVVRVVSRTLYRVDFYTPAAGLSQCDTVSVFELVHEVETLALLLVVCGVVFMAFF